MKAEAAHCYDILNAYARRYVNASSTAEKRQALQDYLSELRILAIIAGQRYERSDFLPLEELQEYLRQIDNGESPELLTPPPRKNGGAPQTPRGAQWQWARASALITVLMKKFEKNEDEAARITVRALKELGRSPPGRGRRDPVKSMKDWRDKLIAGQKGEQAKEWYNNALIAPLSFRWGGKGKFEKRNEKRVLQILLDPSRLDFEMRLTF